MTTSVCVPHACSSTASRSNSGVMHSASYTEHTHRSRWHRQASGRLARPSRVYCAKHLTGMWLAANAPWNGRYDTYHCGVVSSLGRQHDSCTGTRPQREGYQTERHQPVCAHLSCVFPRQSAREGVHARVRAARLRTCSHSAHECVSLDPRVPCARLVQRG